MHKPLALPGAPAESAGEKTSSGTRTLGAIVTVVVSLGIVLGLFTGCAWLMRRGLPNTAKTLPADAVSVLGRAPLAGRQQMHLVRFGNKMLLVCVSPTGVDSLGEITDPAEIDRLAGLCEQQQPTSTRRRSSRFSAKSLAASRLQVGSLPNRQQPRRLAMFSRTTRRCCIVAAVAFTIGIVGFANTAVPQEIANSAAKLELPSALAGGPDKWTSPEGLSSTIQVMLLLTVLSLAPAVLLMTTCFVRIVVVLGLLRQALGTQQLPPVQVITSLALFLTLLGHVAGLETDVRRRRRALHAATNYRRTSLDAWHARRSARS